MYVLRLKQELRRKFQDLGPENVGAFIIEPVVGAVSFAFTWTLQGKFWY